MNDFSYCKTLARLLDRDLVTLPDGTESPLAGGSTKNNLRILRHLIESESCCQTLEIGLAFGVSALGITSSLKDFSSSLNFHHTAIDPFQTSDFESIATSLINEEGLAEHFTLIEKSSSLALAEAVLKDRKFDLIYIDGSHLFEDVFVDFYFSAQLLKPNGILMFDDCTAPHVRKLIRFINRNYSDFLEQIMIDSSVVDLDWKRKIARRLGYSQAKVFRKIADPPRNWDAPFKAF